MNAQEWLLSRYDQLKDTINRDELTEEYARAFLRAFTSDLINDLPLQIGDKDKLTFNDIIGHIVENRLVGIWVINSDGETVYSNNTARTILCASNDQADLSSYHQHIFKHDSNSVRMRPISNTTPPIVEVGFADQNGSQKFLLMSETPLFSKDGTYNGCISLFTEITQRKVAEQALSEISRRYRSISEMISDYVYSIRATEEGTFDCEWVSGAFGETTGYTHAELKLLPDGYLSLIPDEFQKEFVLSMQEARLTNNERIYKIIHKDGTFRWIKDYACIIIEDGEIKMLGAALDITATKEAEETLQKEREFNALISDTIPVGVMVFDECEHVIYANNQCQSILRKPKEFILQQVGITSSKWGFYSLEGRVIQKDAHPLKDLFSKKTEIKGVRFATFNKHDQTIYISVNASPIYQNDEFKGVVATYEDITKEIVAEHALFQAKKMAEESDKLKSTFLGNISHEIRTPLNGIVGFSDMLRQPELSIEQKSRYVDIISKSSHQLIQIVNDIIDIAKLESNQFTINEKECSINNIMANVEEVFQNELRLYGKKIELIRSKPLSEHLSSVMIDGKKLEQIFTKLLSNALKFTAKGSIAVGCTVKNQNFQFFVKDTGIGIPKEKANVIFRNFRQADEKMSRNYGGNGLGLSISKGLVELMGGDIWFESVPGEGTTFYFAIPYHPVSSDDVTENVPAQTDWTGKKILLVDDDPFNMEFLKEILVDTNATILEASDGHAAVDVCLEHRDVDIIFMDIRLPDISGTKTTVLIKNFLEDVVVIAQTANALPEDRQACFDAGCSDFISKPYTKGAILRIVSKYLFTTVND